MKNTKSLQSCFFILLLLFISFYTLQAETEPNDTYQQADEISLNINQSGYLDAADDKDWYKISVTVDGRLTMNDITSSALDYYINLYENDGITLITQIFRYSDNSGGTLSVSLTPGDYYIQFDRYSSGASGTYEFTAEYINVARAGDTEPNDSVEIAQEISLNTSVSANLGFRKIKKYDDFDWYKFTVTNDGRLTILDTTESTLDYYINLYEEDGQTLITQVYRYVDNSGSILSVSLLPGVYYIHFDKYGTDFNTYGEYYFTPEFIEVSRVGDTEPNDSVEIAQEISLNTSVSANLGFRKIKKYDDFDWYKFTVTNDGRLTILDTTESTLDYYINLYEEDGQTLITQVYRYGDNSGSILSISLLPGEYYIHFDKYGTDFNTYGEYYFTLEFTEVSMPGDTEPNDSIQDARILTLDSINSGNLGHRKTGYYDDQDWWKITLPEKGILTLYDTNDVTLDYYINLYNAIDTSLVTQVFRYGDGSGSRLSASLDSGIYYVQFDKYSSDFFTYGSYYFYSDFLPIPKADFSFVQNVSSFNFNNNSSDGESYLWMFGDDNTSIEVNPAHNYIDPGEYKVCLIANNEAGSDTICHYTTVYGIQKIISNEGGNTGDASVDIYGGGFTTESKVKFTRSGFEDIIPDTILYPRRGVLSALINLRGAELGKWDVVVETPGKNTITEEDGYTVIEGTAPEPWVEINGRNRALIGRWQTYTINYGNKGNVDAAGVPLWLAITKNPDTEITFVDFKVVPPAYAVNTLGLEDVLLDSIPIFFDTDTLFGEAFNARVFPLFIPIIPAGQTGQFTIKVKSLENFQVMAWVNPPMFESPMSQEVKDCIFWAQMKAIGDGVISIAGEFIPGLGCINSVVTNYIYNPWNYEKPGDDEPQSIGSHIWKLASTVIDCAGEIPIFKAYKLTVSILQLGNAIINNNIADKQCREAFENKSKRNINVRTVTSFDPNEKTGPEGFTEDNYILKTPFISYTIYFENKDTAKAPAQEILIIDTLDTEAFDISEINFKSITIADTTISILPGLTEFAIDIDMRPGMEIIARATGQIDTVNGILTWHFNALDPLTMDENENPDIGVLLPNVISPQGEGNVSFSAGIKSEKEHDDIIKNSAVITFDYNKPITTNEHISHIDSENPQSTILPLADQTINENINMELQGTDSGSGIDYYTVYASIDDSDYLPVIKTLSTNVSYIPIKSGNYKFYSIATDKLGNTEDIPDSYDTESEVVVSVKSIKKAENSIGVWPNPTNEMVNIDLNVFKNKEVLIELKSVLGQSLLVVKLPQDHALMHTLNITEYKQGIYYMSIKNNTREYIERIVLY